jgi:hypothetical protein
MKLEGPLGPSFVEDSPRAVFKVKLTLTYARPEPVEGFERILSGFKRSLITLSPIPAAVIKLSASVLQVTTARQVAGWQIGDDNSTWCAATHDSNSHWPVLNKYTLI